MPSPSTEWPQKRG